MKLLERAKYTYDHKKAFLRIEKELFGSNTLRGCLHDLDKLLLMFILGYKLANYLHKKLSRHHDRAYTEKDYEQMTIDFECARYTKADKPLNAYDTLMTYYPYLIDKMLPILMKLKIDKSGWRN